MQKQKGIFTAGKGQMQGNMRQGGESWVYDVWSVLWVEGELADPACLWGSVCPTGWYFSQLLGGDNVSYIWNSHHLCVGLLCHSKGFQGHHLKMNLLGILSVRNRRRRAWSEYFSDTCHPSSRAREDVLLIFQTHLYGVQNADQEAKQDENFFLN